MSALNPPMTEIEEDHLLEYRDPRLLFHRAEQVALALLELTNPKNNISHPQARHWLADELCTTLDRLGEIAGLPPCERQHGRTLPKGINRSSRGRNRRMEEAEEQPHRNRA